MICSELDRTLCAVGFWLTKKNWFIRVIFCESASTGCAVCYWFTKKYWLILIKYWSTKKYWFKYWFMIQWSIDSLSLIRESDCTGCPVCFWFTKKNLVSKESFVHESDNTICVFLIHLEEPVHKSRLLAIQSTMFAQYVFNLSKITGS